MSNRNTKGIKRRTGRTRGLVKRTNAPPAPKFEDGLMVKVVAFLQDEIQIYQAAQAAAAQEKAEKEKAEAVAESAEGAVSVGAESSWVFCLPREADAMRLEIYSPSVEAPAPVKEEQRIQLTAQDGKWYTIHPSQNLRRPATPQEMALWRDLKFHEGEAAFWREKCEQAKAILAEGSR